MLYVNSDKELQLMTYSHVRHLANHGLLQNSASEDVKRKGREKHFWLELMIDKVLNMKKCKL